MESFWKRYFKVIIKLCFLPFIVSFILTIWYLTYYGVQGIPKDQRYAFTLEFVVRCIILALIVYFFIFEVLQFIRDGLRYFRDIFNIFDVV